MLALAAVTLVSGVVISLLSHWAWRLWIARSVSLAVALVATSLLIEKGQEAPTQWTWIPEMGSVGLSLQAPALYLTVLVFWGLFLYHTVAHERPPPARRTNLSWLDHLLCVLVVLALIVDHFLVRIILLDLCSLVVVLLLTLELSDSACRYPIVRRYLALRLGDMSLALMVLLLWQTSGTFHIQSTLEHGQVLPLGQRALILAAGQLAAWVKLGLPPFHAWLADGASLGRGRRTLVLASGLPLLGAYLLSRMGPMLSDTSLWLLLAVPGVLSAAWALNGMIRGKHSRLCGWLVAHGALSAMLVVTPLMPFYLLTFLPIRAVLCLAMQPDQSRVPARQGREQSALPGAWGLAASTAATLERSVFEGGLSALTTSVCAFSRVVASFVEAGLLDDSILRVRRATLATARFLQGRHSGQLRRYLLWMSVALLVVALLVSWQVP